MPNLVFPPGSGVVDVTAHGAVGDGTTDCTAAIQAAMNYAWASNLYNVIYFPNGVYLISDTLIWKDSGGRWRAFLGFWGQSQTGVVIRLKNGSAGFANTSGSPLYNLAPINAKAMLYLASEMESNALGAGESAYYTDVHNLTIDCGSSNPGAQCIDWQASNMASIRDVTLSGTGRVGLNASRGYGGGGVGPALVKNLTINGKFDYCVINGAGEVGITWEHIRVTTSPTTIGFWNSNQNSWVRDLEIVTSGGAQAVLNEGEGNLTLIESNFTDMGTTLPAIQNSAFLFARNISTNGYGSAINGVPGSTVSEYKSIPTESLFPSSAVSLNLPIQETPAPLDDNDFSHWAVVTDYGAMPSSGDVTAQIQAALNAGKAIVFFPSGAYTISGTLNVPTGVRRLLSVYAQLNTGSSAVIQFNGTAGASIDMRGLAFLDDVSILNNASVPLVLADLFHLNGYANVPGSGQTLFVENVAFDNQVTQTGGHVWARQLDIECEITHFTNDAAIFWCLGYKTEGAGLGGTGFGVGETVNNGQTEILGAFNSTPGAGTYKGYFTTDSKVSIAGLSSGSERTTVLTQTETPTTRTFANTGNRLGGTALPLYTGFASPPSAPTIICDSPPDGVVGIAYTHAFPASGGTPPYTFSIISGALPDGLSLDTATGIVSGTPTTPGPFSFTVQVTDAAAGGASVGCSFSIFALLTISCDSPPDGVVSSAYTHTFPVVGGVTPYTFAIIAGTLPAGLSLDAATGIVSGTPTALGIFTFTIQVTDAVAGTSSTGCTITVVDTLTITCGNPSIATVGVPYSHTFPAMAGTPPYTFTISAGALPPGVTLDPATGIVSGIPTSAGVYSFTIQVVDTVGGL